MIYMIYKVYDIYMKSIKTLVKSFERAQVLEHELEELKRLKGVSSRWVLDVTVGRVRVRERLDKRHNRIQYDRIEYSIIAYNRI